MTGTAPTGIRTAGSRRIAIGLAGLQMGGCQINAIDLARTMRARGNEVVVFAVRDDDVRSTILPYAAKAGFTVTLLEDRAGGFGTGVAIAKFARRHDADVVHVFEPWLNRPAAIAAALDRKVAVVETNWNMENLFWGSSRIPLIVGTGSMLDEARLRRRAAVHLMEPPIDAEADRPEVSAGERFRAEHGIGVDALLAVLVSRVDKAMKRESILDAIAAVDRLGDPSAVLVVVGDGDALVEVRVAADRVNRRLGRTAVQAIGALADPRPAYNAADVVLAMGGAAIRGLAHGKPVIVLGERAFSGIYEPSSIAHFRSEGFYGLGTGLGGAELLGSHLEALLADPGRRRELGAFGLREVQDRFGLDAAAQALEAIYDDAMAHVPSATMRLIIGATQVGLGWAQRARAAARRTPAIVGAARLCLTRWASVLPRPVRVAVRRVVPSAAVAPPALEGWDQTLIGGARTPLVWPAATSPAPPTSPQLRQEDRDAVRCLLVTESLDAGGMDEFVAFLARRLPEHGIHAGVMLAADSSGWRHGRIADALLAEGVDVFSADEATGGAALARFAPDVLYSHGAMQWPLRAARAAQVPTAEALHGMHNVFGRTSHDLAARREMLDAIVTVSDLVRRQYLAIDREAPGDMVLTIPNGIDRARLSDVDRTEARHALGITNEFVFVSPARHTVQKNTFGLTAAFLEAAAQRSGMHLLLCGRPDDADYLRQVVGLRDRSSAADRLHLRGNAARVDVLFAAADAFVLDSFFEGWSLASMEALGMGVPSLLSDVGGAREQLRGGPARGTLISNPMGDPLLVGWESMARSRYTRQANHDELIQALLDFVDGATPWASRAEIASDARKRFSADACLSSHAEVVRRVAVTATVREAAR